MREWITVYNIGVRKQQLFIFALLCTVHYHFVFSWQKHLLKCWRTFFPKIIFVFSIYRRLDYLYFPGSRLYSIIPLLYFLQMAAYFLYIKKRIFLSQYSILTIHSCMYCRSPAANTDRLT